MHMEYIPTQSGLRKAWRFILERTTLRRKFGFAMCSKPGPNPQDSDWRAMVLPQKEEADARGKTAMPAAAPACAAKSAHGKAGQGGKAKLV